MDDGSTDGSGEVCDRYASRDARFRVIHQENRGLSAARNTGLDRMTGDIVAFMDPDDAFHPDMVRRLLEPMLREKADIPKFRYHNVYSTGIMKHNHLKNTATMKTHRILSREETLSALADGTLDCTVWDKLYIRTLWRALRFPEGHVFEDIDTTYRVIDRIHACCVVDDVLVFHRIRPGSITQKPTVATIEDWLRASDHHMTYMQAHSPSMISWTELACMKQTDFTSLLWYYGMLQWLKIDAVTHARWKRLVLEAGQAVNIRDCGLRIRVAYVLARHCSRLYGLVYHGYIAVKMTLCHILHF